MQQRVVALGAGRNHASSTTRATVLSAAGQVGLLGALAAAHVVPWVVARWVLAPVFWAWCVVACALPLVYGWDRFVRERRDGSAWSQAHDGTTRLFLVLSVVGIILAGGRELILGLLRTFGGHVDLTFNIDGRYLLMHAWSMLRNGGAAETLAMSGTPINYHSGPAWFAAASASVLGGGPEVWLFLWFPLAAVITGTLAGFTVLRRLGAAPAAAAVGLALAASPLWEVLRSLEGRASLGVLEALLGPTQTSMLNSLLGLSAILVAVAYVADEPTTRRLVVASGLVGLSSLAKPQYAIAGAMLLFAVALAFRGHPGLGLARILGIPLLAALASVTINGLFIGGTTVLSGVRAARGVVPIPADWRVFDPFLLTEPRFIAAVAVSMLLLGTRPGRDTFEHRAGVLILASGAGLAGLWVLLHLIVASAGSAAVSEVGLWAWDAMQAMVPVLELATAAAAAGLLTLLARRAPWARSALALVLSVGLVVAGHELGREWSDPPAGHEAVDAPYVRELLANVDPAGALLLASDLADPADGFRRPGRAFYLSNAFGHQFWLTQTGYGHQLLPETARRVADIGRFFASPWSSWHVDLLAAEGITHVLVSRRCPAVWQSDGVAMLTPSAAAGGWVLYEVAPPSVLWGIAVEDRRIEGEASADRPDVRRPLDGRAACG